MTTYLIFNGDFVPSDKPIITAQNRAFRYGDGIFETIRISNYSIELAAYHFERLFSGIRLLKFDLPSFFTPEFLQKQITELCIRNNHHEDARIRLTVFRGNGGLYDSVNHFPNYIIESQPIIEKDNQRNRNGLHIDIFTDGYKSVDTFSNLKSNNYLLYAMGALYAKANQLDDCIILNNYGRVCETTISNIFCINGKKIITPPLSEGSVAGVMRRHLLKKLQQSGFEVKEEIIETKLLENASEVFLTNAISGIRWVSYFGNCSYKNDLSLQIQKELLKKSF
ncbi:MAG TPA: aminotransferase class IV [Puia sp.]|nr:aminotransferase class IV [Puia sp.]